MSDNKEYNNNELRKMGLGICCYCNGECNVHSQVCGICSRQFSSEYASMLNPIVQCIEETDEETDEELTDSGDLTITYYGPGSNVKYIYSDSEFRMLVRNMVSNSRSSPIRHLAEACGATVN